MAADRDARERWSAWLRPVTACGALALSWCVLAWGPGRVVAPAVLGVALTGLVAGSSGRTAANDHSDDAMPVRSGSRELVWWCRVAAGCVSVVSCLAVSAMVAPWCLLLVLVALVSTTPPARTWVRARTRPRESAPPVDPLPDARTQDLDTAELCHLWRVTFWMVRDLRAPTRTLRVVELREAILDELERRHPEGVGRWLTSARPGADGPARFL